MQRLLPRYLLPGMLFVFAWPCLAAEQPNILLIVADDMGYSDLGCYGGEINTPNLDRLASRGLRLTQFYNTAKCHTSRASLLTGLYWQQAMQPDKYQLGDRGVTIAEVLRAAGYWTAIAGKWHLSPLGKSDQAPLDRGFERFFGTLKGAGSFYDPLSLQRDRAPVKPAEGFYYTDAITDEAVADIRHASAVNKPLFLYVAYTAPHWPLHALPEDIAKYRGIYSKGREAVRKARYARMKKLGILPDHFELSPRENAVDWKSTPDRPWQERRMEVYAAMVDRMDQGIGRIVQSLEQTGQLENTLLMFLSDNGACAYDVQGALAADCLGNRLETRDGQAIVTGPIPSLMPGPESTFQAYGIDWANVSNTPYRKYKASSFEGGIRTPCILHWPAETIRLGRIVHEVTHLIDVMPTCVEAAEANYPDVHRGKSVLPLEGMSLSRLMRDEKLAPRTLFQQFKRGAALRHGKWKIVTPNYETGNWALYDMDTDGTEMHDLAAKHPVKLAALIDQWQQWAHRVDVRQ